VPRPRFESADPALKQRLMDAAIGEFAKDGYEGASLNRILERAEMSKGSFYYYFDDKADLAIGVIESVIDVVYPNVPFPPCDDAASYWRAMADWQHEILRVFLSAREKTEAVSRIGMSMMKDAALRERVQPLVAAKGGEFAKHIVRGQELGAIRKDMSLPLLLSVGQSLKEGLSRVMLPADRAASAKEIEQLTELMLDLLQRIAKPGGTP
jgi:AcrR family transcriptional regulator